MESMMVSMGLKLVTFWFLLCSFAMAAEGIAFFESKVRPILDEHCLKCHSEAKKVKGGLLLDRKAGWEEGGDSGAVIVPGKPEESLLIQMVNHEAEVEAMPPKSKLSEGEILILTEWIKMGAPDPRDEAIGKEVKKSSFDLEERKKWWSLQPVAEIAVPKVKDEEWAREDLDRFVLRKLEEKGWRPAEETDGVTLLRRASVILTGLAPSTAELDEFLADQNEGAYDRAVDRMMASPHFGEQWARHWMDVVRYGESKAFENDYWMPHAWRYRDYLIRAFNEDVPFDQFVREAFAGDLIENPRVNPKTGANESVAGPGFFHLADGHHGVTDLHEDEARVIDSMINVVGTAFHGLTISCARCHDHKFDAITARDYYSMYGIFRSSRLHHANVKENQWNEEREVKLRGAHSKLGEEVLSTSGSQIGPVLEKVRELSQRGDLVEAWQKMNPRDAKGLAQLREELKKEASPVVAKWFEAIHRVGGRPELAGMKRFFQGVKRKGNKGEALKERKWIIEGVGFESAEEGRFVINPDDDRVIVGAAGKGMVVGHLSPRLDGAARSADFVVDGSPVKIWVKGQGATVSLVIRNYELVGHGPTTSPLRQSVNSNAWRLFQFPTDLWKGEVAYLQIQHQGGSKRLHTRNASVVPLRNDAWVAFTTELPHWDGVWSRGESLEEVLEELMQSTKNSAEVEILGALFSEGLIEVDQSRLSELQNLKVLRDEVEMPEYARSLVDGTIADESVYIRGNHSRPSEEENPRSFLAGLNGEVISGEGSGRREWAERLVAQGNPLTARVRVNRIWSRVFGRGIVGSVDDFGKMGELPSHPELLDFLANDFVNEKWSTKAMIRKMLLSSTFRMSSVPESQAADLDPDNVFLQRMPVRRMSAEAIRDHILAASGDLKRDLFGPSVLAYIKDQPPSRARPQEGPLGGNGRRSIYLASRRNYLPSFLRAFDSPNTTEPIGKRNVTTVPAQSLALLNHPLVHQQAKKWSERILKGEGDDRQKLKELHRVAFSREASEEELEWGLGALEKFGVEKDLEGAWASLSHVIFNRKEFIYVF